MITKFEEVSIRGEKRVKCAGECGRTLKRAKKFYMTLNPFNKNPDGTIRTRSDIYNELRQRIAEWQKEPEICSHCLSMHQPDIDY